MLNVAIKENKSFDKNRSTFYYRLEFLSPDYCLQTGLPGKSTGQGHFLITWQIEVFDWTE